MAEDNRHSITLKVAGREYSLVATAETEHYLRRGADRINAALADYDRRYPSQTLVDKLVFVALTESVSLLSTKRNLDRETADVAKLSGELHSYLDKIKD